MTSPPRHKVPGSSSGNPVPGTNDGGEKLGGRSSPLINPSLVFALNLPASPFAMQERDLNIGRSHHRASPRFWVEPDLALYMGKLLL